MNQNAISEFGNTEHKRLKILFLSPRFPYPIIGGDKLKSYHLLTHLAKKHDVTSVSLYPGSEPPTEYINAIEKLGVEVFAIPMNIYYAGFKAGTIKLLKYPLEISYYTQPKFMNLVKQLTSERNYDLAFAFFMRTTQYLKDIPIKKILIAEDCRTLYQKRSYETSKNIVQKLVRFWDYRMLKRFEPDIVNYFDATTLVTEKDIMEMRRQNPNAKYRLLTNGVDLTKFYMPENSVTRSGIIFSGKLNVWANEQIAKKIIKEILPIIKSKAPDIKLEIVGAEPHRSIKSLASDSVKIYPDVTDMVPYLQRAKLFLNPHNGGSGIQNKILEAMACGCPVVTTPTGIQGIPAKHGIDVLIGKTNEELVKHTLSILNDSELARNISLNGRRLIEQTHSWEKVYSALDDIIEETLSE